MKFVVYDLDNDTSSLGDDDFLGQRQISLGEVKVQLSLVTMM